MAGKRRCCTAYRDGSDPSCWPWCPPPPSDGNSELLAVYQTKSTPVFNAVFSRTNILISAGVFDPTPVVVAPGTGAPKGSGRS